MQIRQNARREWRNRTTARRGRTTYRSHLSSFKANFDSEYVSQVMTALRAVALREGKTEDQVFDEAMNRIKRFDGNGRFYRSPIVEVCHA